MLIYMVWLLNNKTEHFRPIWFWDNTAVIALKNMFNVDKESSKKFKVRLIVFFDDEDVPKENWVSNREKVKQHGYKKVLKTLQGRLKRQKPQLYENGFLLNHSSTHSALSEAICNSEIQYLSTLPIHQI